MTARVFEDQGAARLNVAGIVGRVQSTGPMSLIVENLSDAGNGVVAMVNQRTQELVPSDRDTLRADEDTGYDGDDSEVSFTGQALNNLPVVPGSVLVKPAAGGTTVNLFDRDLDGVLYTADEDEDEAGTINYHTGALALDFPVGKEPNTGDIDCTYYSQSAPLRPRGVKSYNLANVPYDDTIEVRVAASVSAGIKVRTSGVGRSV